MKRLSLSLALLVACSGRLGVDPILSPDVRLDANVGATSGWSDCPLLAGPTNIDVVGCTLGSDGILLAVDRDTASVGNPLRFWVLSSNGITSHVKGGASQLLVPRSELAAVADLDALSHTIGKIGNVLAYVHPKGATSEVVLQTSAKRQVLFTAPNEATIVCNSFACASLKLQDVTKGNHLVEFFDPPDAEGNVSFFSGVSVSSGLAVLGISPDTVSSTPWALTAYASITDDRPPGFTYVNAYSDKRGITSPGYTMEDTTAEGGIKTSGELALRSAFDEAAAYVPVHTQFGAPKPSHLIARVPVGPLTTEPVGYITTVAGTNDWSKIRAVNGQLYGVSPSGSLVRISATKTPDQPVSLLDGMSNVGPVAREGNDVYVTFSPSGVGGVRVIAKVKP